MLTAHYFYIVINHIHSYERVSYSQKRISKFSSLQVFLPVYGIRVGTKMPLNKLTLKQIKTLGDGLHSDGGNLYAGTGDHGSSDTDATTNLTTLG